MFGGRSSGPVDETLYNTLNVRPDASQADIKKSYFKLAKEYHPDKNTDHGDKFKEISFAYEVLSNPEKRKMYDMSGLEGVQNGGGGGGFSSSNLFSQFFDQDDDDMGGHPFGNIFGGFGRGAQRRRKFQDTIHKLELSLEQLFAGKTSKLKMKKNVLCKTCDGSGGKKGQVYKCNECRGRGTKIVTQPIGPGMMQQIQIQCDGCRGTGGKVPESDKCKTCNGQQCVPSEKILEVIIPPGSRHGDKITFQGEGDQKQPDVEAGDVVVVVVQKEHDLFEREGDDLHFKKTITLNEALCGFKFLIKHVDGEPLVLRLKPGEVVKPGKVKGVLGKGMPNKRNRDLRGNLFVHFEVEFPSAHFLSSDEEYTKLRNLLPTANTVNVPANSTEVSLMEYDEKKYARRGGDAYHEDSDDDEVHGGHGGQGVRCQHQ